MSDTIYLKVKNWERFQQYKDGRPLRWIKLYVRLLGDFEFDRLPEPTQIHLVKLWLVAAENDNRIPCEPGWIARHIGAKSPVDLLTLIEDGWLGVHAPHDVESALKYVREHDVQFRTEGEGGERTTHALAREEQRRVEESTGDSLPTVENTPGASAAVGNSPSKENRWSETVTACREYLWLSDQPPDGRTIGQELSVAKQLTDRWNLDPPEVAEAVEGFARLRDRGFWEGWIERNEPAKMLALNRTPEDEQGIPVVVRCLHEMRKGEPASRADSGLERLEVSA